MDTETSTQTPAAAVAAAPETSFHREVAAFRHALEALVPAIAKNLASNDADHAFDLIVALDDALSPSADLERALDELLAVGKPGEVVEAELRRHAETLEDRRAQLARRQEELARLAAVQQAIRAHAEEAEALQQELDELRRLERLASSLDELRSARQALDDSGGAAIEAARAEETAFEASATAALAAATAAGGELRVEVREVTARAVACAEELAQQRAKLTEARDDIARDEAEIARITAEVESSRLHHETVRARLRELTDGWKEHLAADREIAAILVDGLGPSDAGRGHQEETRADVDAVEQVSEHIEAHLGQLDGLLQTLLLEAEAREEHDHGKRRAGPEHRDADGGPTDRSASED